MVKRRAMRTKKGTATSRARSKSGMKDGSRKGKYPIFDSKSCKSAVKLRHHGKGVTASAVLAKASRWASSHNDSG